MRGYRSGIDYCFGTSMQTSILVAAALLMLTPARSNAQDPTLVAKGQKLAVQHKCSLCHVVEGKGGKIGKPLDGVAERHDAAALKRILADPQKEFPDAKVKMPKVAWAAGDIDAVVAYLQTLKGKAEK